MKHLPRLVTKADGSARGRALVSRVLTALQLGRVLLIFVALGSAWLAISLYAGREGRHRWATRLSRFGLALAGVSLDASAVGAGFRDRKPRVFVANHVNLLDPFVLQAALDVPLTALLYISYLRTPIWGAIARRIGLIAIDNHSVLSSLAAIEAAKRALASGVSVLVMPEGRRTADGELGKFHAGAALIARRAAVEIQPVVQIGAFEVLHGGHARPGTVTVRPLTPYPAAAVAAETPQRVIDEIRRQMSRVLDEERGRCGGPRQKSGRSIRS